MEISPTFWLKDVMGEQPNTPPEMAETKPSTHRDIEAVTISIIDPVGNVG